MTRLDEVRVGQTYSDEYGHKYRVTKIRPYCPAFAVPRPAAVHGADMISYEGVGNRTRGVASRGDFSNRMYLVEEEA